jgi:hypothetical protein
MLTLEDDSQVNELPDNYNGWVTNRYGNKFWYHNGKIHRLNGPAYEEASGTKAWCRYGKYYRLDGPAIEWFDGSKSWWINGEQITKQTRIVLIYV